MCTSCTAQPASRFPCPSLTPPSLHVSQGHEKHFSWMAWTHRSLHDVHAGDILLCPLPKANAHQVLGACIACTEACEMEMSWLFEVGIQKPVDLKVGANSGASIFTCGAKSKRDQPCPSNWSLLRFMTFTFLPLKTEHKPPAWPPCRYCCSGRSMSLQRAWGQWMAGPAGKTLVGRRESSFLQHRGVDEGGVLRGIWAMPFSAGHPDFPPLVEICWGVCICICLSLSTRENQLLRCSRATVTERSRTAAELVLQDTSLGGIAQPGCLEAAQLVNRPLFTFPVT